jgi:hypothetical protein
MRILFSILYAPAIYFAFLYFDINMNILLTFKLFPLFMSFLVTGLILKSYYSNNSMVLQFANKLRKYNLDIGDDEYIKKSTLFWVGVSSVNVLVHIYMYFQSNTELWVFYASIGWYSVFIVGGILQLFHRHFIYSK